MIYCSFLEILHCFWFLFLSDTVFLFISSILLIFLGQIWMLKINSGKIVNKESQGIDLSLKNKLCQGYVSVKWTNLIGALQSDADSGPTNKQWCGDTAPIRSWENLCVWELWWFLLIFRDVKLILNGLQMCKFRENVVCSYNRRQTTAGFDRWSTAASFESLQVEKLPNKVT